MPRGFAFLVLRCSRCRHGMRYCRENQAEKIDQTSGGMTVGLSFRNVVKAGPFRFNLSPSRIDEQVIGAFDALRGCRASWRGLARAGVLTDVTTPLAPTYDMTPEIPS